MRSISTRIAAIVACALLSLTGFAAPAHAAGEVSAYTVEGSVAADGVLSVHAELALTGGPDQIVQRFATTRSASANQQYVYKIEGVKATAGGQPVEAKVATEGDYQVVTIPVAGKDAATLDYTVTGAAVADGGSTTVAWRLLQGLNLPVRVFDATVKTPGPFTAIDCAAGPPANPGNCKRYAGGTHEQSDPFFSDGPRGVGEVVQVELRFPTAVVAGNQEVRRVWTLDHGFSAAPIPLAVAVWRRWVRSPSGCCIAASAPTPPRTPSRQRWRPSSRSVRAAWRSGRPTGCVPDFSAPSSTSGSTRST